MHFIRIFPLETIQQNRMQLYFSQNSVLQTGNLYDVSSLNNYTLLILNNIVHLDIVLHSNIMRILKNIMLAQYLEFVIFLNMRLYLIKY